jgi:hypothetical protein
LLRVASSVVPAGSAAMLAAPVALADRAGAAGGLLQADISSPPATASAVAAIIPGRPGWVRTRGRTLRGGAVQAVASLPGFTRALDLIVGSSLLLGPA